MPKFNFDKRTLQVFFVGYITVIVTLFFSFELFRGYESQTERMVLSRVVGTEIYGEGFGNNLLLFIQNQDTEFSSNQSIPNWVKKIGLIANHQLLAEYSFEKNAAEIYTSQFGLMGNLASELSQNFNLHLWQVYVVLKIFALAVQAIIVIHLISIFFIYFGQRAALFIFLLYLTPWLLIFSTNFFYLIHLNLIFFTIPIIVNKLFEKKVLAQVLIIVFYFFLSFVYSLMSYMFITIWIANVFLSIIFENAYSIKKISVRIVAYRITSVIAGFFTAIILHLNRLNGIDVEEKGQSWKIYILQNKIGIVQSEIVDDRYRTSIFVGVFENLTDFFKMPFLTPWVQNRFHDFLPNVSIGLFMLALLSIIAVRVVRDSSYRTFCLSYGLEIVLVCAIGVFTWLNLLRPQSADNIHLNTIIFFLPMIQILIGLSVIDNKSMSKFREKRLKKATLILYVAMLTSSFLVSKLILLSAQLSEY
jgi:hypothetical protein